jgi:hypothetical protein
MTRNTAAKMVDEILTDIKEPACPVLVSNLEYGDKKIVRFFKEQNLPDIYMPNFSFEILCSHRNSVGWGTYTDHEVQKKIPHSERCTIESGNMPEMPDARCPMKKFNSVQRNLGKIKSVRRLVGV